MTKYIIGITDTKTSITTELDNIYPTIHTTSTLTTAITRKNSEPSGIATRLNLSNSTWVDGNIFWPVRFQI